MISDDQIREAVAILVREAQPERVILFGSYARGEATSSSDLDLLVVEKEVRHQQAEMARLRRALSPLRIPVDVLVSDVARLSSSWADCPAACLYDALRDRPGPYSVDRTAT